MNYYRCWGCCSLRAGVIIVGVLTMFAGSANIVLGVSYLHVSFCRYIDNHYYCIYFQDWIGICTMVLGSLEFLTPYLLLIGVHQKKPNLFLSYCIAMGFDALGSFGIGIYLIASLYTFGKWWFGIWMIIWSCILCYFISVIGVYFVLVNSQLLRERGQITVDLNLSFYPGITRTAAVTQTRYVAPGYGIPPPLITQMYTPNTNQTAYLPPGAYPAHSFNLPFGENLQQMFYSTPGPNLQPQRVQSYTIVLN